MKRYVLLFSLFSMILSAAAQKDPIKDEKKKKKIDFLLVVTAGWNMSNISGESDSYSGLLPGGYLGVNVNVLDFSDVLSLRVGTEFSMQGGKYKEEATGEPPYNYGGGSGSLRLNYINIPVTCRYQSKGGFFAEAGLQPGFLISAKDKFEGETTDYKNYVNKFDMGLIVGGGYQVTKKIGVGLRVCPGVTNINKNESTYGGGYEMPKDHNLTLSLRGSYSF